MTSLAKNMNSKKNNMLTLGALMLVMLVLALAENFLDSFSMQIFKLCAINIILALSLNLINGFTGLFSLGHAGFMAIGDKPNIIADYMGIAGTKLKHR